MSPDATYLPADAQRFIWYNPMLDPHVIAAKMTPGMAEAAEEGLYNDGSTKMSGRLHTPDEGHPYNLVSSLCRDGFHRPALDIDKDWLRPDEVETLVQVHTGTANFVVLVRSTTNWHAYVPGLELPWDEYMSLLNEMADNGVLERAYVEASESRGQTLLRPPHIKKGDRAKRSAFHENGAPR